MNEGSELIRGPSEFVRSSDGKICIRRNDLRMITVWEGNSIWPARVSIWLTGAEKTTVDFTSASAAKAACREIFEQVGL